MRFVDAELEIFEFDYDIDTITTSTPDTVDNSDSINIDTAGGDVDPFQ